MNWGVCGGPVTGWMAGMMVLSALAGVTLVVLLVVALVAAVRWLWRSPGPGRAEDRAPAILRERYARGEIEREEFEARWRDLSNR